MILVGLTGGIGSGKSTVSSMLAARGAEIVDADVITKDVQQRGSPIVEAIAKRFGDEVLDAQRGLRRAKLAEMVFADADALADLNAIVHPAVGAEINRRVDEMASTDKVVVLDIPLLTENPRGKLQGKIVVDVPIEVQVDRLVRFPGIHRSRCPRPHCQTIQSRGSTTRRGLRHRELRHGRRTRATDRRALEVADIAAATPRRLHVRQMITLADPMGRTSPRQ